MIKDKIFKQRTYMLEIYPLDQVSPFPFIFVEKVAEDDLDVGFAEHVEFQLVLRSCQVDDGINTVAPDGKPCPAEGFQNVERAREDANRALLFLQDVNRGQVGEKPNHVDRFRNVIIDIIPRLVYEDV